MNFHQIPVSFGSFLRNLDDIQRFLANLCKISMNSHQIAANFLRNLDDFHGRLMVANDVCTYAHTHTHTHLPNEFQTTSCRKYEYELACVIISYSP